jgi:hypothetical protein
MDTSSAITGKRGHRLSLLDAMVMIAATALGILATRWALDLRHLFVRHMQFGDIAQRVVQAANVFLPPLLVAWSCAGLALGLRRHRLALRALARRPGFVACLTATLLTVYYTATFFTPRAMQQPKSMGLQYLNLLFTLSDHVGPAIAGAWLVHGLMGRRFFGAAGVEFLGRLVGLGRLCLFFVNTMLAWLLVLVEGL